MILVLVVLSVSLKKMRLNNTEYARKKPPLEVETQRQILTWLKLKGIFAFRVNTGGLRRNGKWVPSPTITKGTADIIALHNARFIAIEVKRIGGKLSDDQVEFLKGVTASGGLAIVAYSLNDVRTHLEPLAFPR